MSYKVDVPKYPNAPEFDRSSGECVFDWIVRMAQAHREEVKAAVEYHRFVCKSETLRKAKGFL